MAAFEDALLPTELLMQIFHHLPFRDMKSVRLVCKRWNLIADQTKFTGNFFIKITPRNCVDVLARLQESPLGWKQRMQNLRLFQMKSTPELMAILKLAGSFVKTLELIDSTLHHSIEQQLPNVQELRLSNIPCDSHDNEADIVDLQCFPNLNSLVLGANLSQQFKFHLLRQLSISDDRVLQLQLLKFQFSSEEEEHTVNVMRKHASTLKALELNYFSHHHLNVGCWMQIFQNLSKLASLQLTGGYSNDWLYAVFASLPAEIKIKHLDLTGCFELDDRTLELILQRWPRTLKKLSLMFCSRITDNSLRHLQHQQNLRMLNLSHCSPMKIGPGLIQGIASFRNLHLRRLYLNDAYNMNEESFCLLIRQLPNLEHLSLSGCTNVITDHTMSNICQNLQQLQLLDLNQCYKLSDVGLLGRNGDSIQHLRRLHTLNLCGYRNLTDAALQNVLILDKLRSLTLGYSHKISAKGIASLVRNCPLLENLTITSCLMIDDEAIWHIATGLKKLRKLNISNCVNLTERTIDLIEEHCDQLVELLVTGIDAINVIDVERRLWKMQPQVEVATAKEVEHSK